MHPFRPQVSAPPGILSSGPGTATPTSPLTSDPRAARPELALDGQRRRSGRCALRLPEQAGQQRHERSDRASRGGREPRGGHHGGRASAGHGRLPGLPALIDNAARVVGRLGLTPRQSGQPGRGGVADRLLTTASLPVVCRAPPTRAGRHLRACPPEPCRRTLGARRPERPRRRGMRLRQPLPFVASLPPCLRHVAKRVAGAGPFRRETP